MRIVRAMRPLLLAGIWSTLCLAQGAAAQGRTADLEAQLSSTTGLERARVLARLVDAAKFDRPTQAIAYGREALELLTHHPDSAVQVSTLSELGWAYMQLSRFDEAVSYADSARRLAARVGLRRGEARAISNLGTIAQRRGDPEMAIERFREALGMQRALGEQRDIANSLNNLGFVHSTDLANYPTALAEHLEALRIREGLGDSMAVASSLNNIGIVYGRIHQVARAREYFERALVMRRTMGNQTRVAGTLSNLGDMYLESGSPQRALAAYQEALSIRTPAGDPAAISTSHRNLAQAYLALGQLKDAEREIDEAEHLGGRLEDRGVQVGNLLARSAIEKRLGRADDAERHAKSALEISQAMGSRENVRRSLGTLSAAQEASRSHLAALQSLQRAKAVGDSIYDATTAARLVDLETRFTRERREHELEQLRRDEAEAELVAERRGSQRNAAIGVAALIALLGIISWSRRVDHARIAQELSITDPLTEAKNRRYVEQTISADLAVSARRHLRAAQRGALAEEADIVFLLLDLDHFKGVNDRHGHAAGDDVLRAVVQVLRDTCRQSDVIVRWGGEEFLVIGRFTDRSLAAIHAQRLREAVEACAVRLTNGTMVRVTASIGYAAYPLLTHNPEANSWRQLVALADLACYVAKESGRNRCAGLFAAQTLTSLNSDAVTKEAVRDAVERGTLLLEDDVARAADEPVGLPA